MLSPMTDTQLLDAHADGRITLVEVTRARTDVYLDGERIGSTADLLSGRPWSVKKVIYGFV